MEAFYVMGSVLAVWALLISLIGVVRKGFPGSRGGEIAIGAITACLVAIAIGTAIVGSIANSEHDEDPDHAALPTLSA